MGAGHVVSQKIDISLLVAEIGHLHFLRFDEGRHHTSLDLMKDGVTLPLI